MTSNIKIAYQMSNSLSDIIWKNVQFWGVFAQTIVGNKFLNSIDEATLDLAKCAKIKNEEKKEKFLEDAREKLIECFIWNDRARCRRLLEKEDYQIIYVQLNKISRLIDPKELKKKKS